MHSAIIMHTDDMQWDSGQMKGTNLLVRAADALMCMIDMHDNMTATTY